ncbi:MAG: PilZ domain-containing protein [Candidatus Manganitrophaceae bacterium]|nr:MAG: PilZ domain-containing protein [Candidatus Manganitrophaceae bacterium]
MFYKKKQSIDYRRYPRIPLTARVRFTPPGVEQWNGALIRSISTHGLGLYTDERVKKGDRLLIELSLVTDENEPLHELILGEVVWAETGEAKTRYSAGIYFGDIAEKHPKLHAYLKRLEDAIVALP